MPGADNPCIRIKSFKSSYEEPKTCNNMSHYNNGQKDGHKSNCCVIQSKKVLNFHNDGIIPIAFEHFEHSTNS
jgi:hypothetical protein